MPDEATTAIQGIGGAPQTSQEILQSIFGIWFDGGWVMIPLLFLAVFIYYEATAVVLQLRRTGVKKTPRKVWLEWIDAPEKGEGHIGELIRYILAYGFVRESIITRIAAARQALLPEVNQKIVLLSVLVTVAPLMGLLGTVIGMLTTFQGLAISSGQTIDLVADGIRVALITTETGLMIAIPGYVFISQVIRKRNEYNAFLTELESHLVQRADKIQRAESA